MLGRRVRWLAGIEKRRLPGAILDTIIRPGAFFLLAKSLRPTIYEEAYGSFVDLSAAGYSSRFIVSEDRFTTESDFRIQAFFNVVASNLKAIQSGTHIKEPYQAAFDELGPFAPELKTNINSPGSLTLVSKHITPLVAAALFALAATIGVEAFEARDTIVIGNSKAPPDDPCTAQVAANAMTQLGLLGLLDWPKACEMARLAITESGMTGSVTIERKP